MSSNSLTRLRSYAAALLAPAILAVVMLLVNWPRGAWPAWASLYLVLVAGVGVLYGWRQALVALVVSSVLLDYFFVGPVNDLSIPNPVDWDVFVAFLLAGFLVAVTIAYRRSRETRLRTALALAQAQAQIAELQDSPDQASASAESNNAQERVRELLLAQADAQDMLSDLSERFISTAGTLAAVSGELSGPAAERLRDEARKVDSLAQEMRGVSHRLRRRSELAS